jgi:hypothetical protein
MWMKTLPWPWTAAMEATIFTAWIYDHLKPHAAAVKVAHRLSRIAQGCERSVDNCAADAGPNPLMIRFLSPAS